MTSKNLIHIQSDYTRLIREIHELRARITELTAFRDDLVYHICPSLQAEYDEKFLSLELELMSANLYLNEMRRTVEILQSQLNQQQEVSVEEARTQARKENEAFEEELHRKAEEAREFKESWERSQWSEYDREEKRAREEADDTHSESAGGQAKSENDAGKQENPTDRIKKLYRQIVKRLHPDVHPDPTEREKALWNLAMKAQQDGDLEQMERIFEELTGMDLPEETFDHTEEGCTKLEELVIKLKERLRLLEEEIARIRSDHPYRLKSFLENPAAVRRKQEEIQSKIDQVRALNIELEAYIGELKERILSGKKQ